MKQKYVPCCVIISVWSGEECIVCRVLKIVVLWTTINIGSFLGSKSPVASHYFNTSPALHVFSAIRALVCITLCRLFARMQWIHGATVMAIVLYKCGLPNYSETFQNISHPLWILKRHFPFQEMRKVSSAPTVSNFTIDMQFFWLQSRILSSKKKFPSKFWNNLYSVLSFTFYKSFPLYRPWRPLGLWEVEAPTFSRQSAHRWR
jgi:hypothetical protein